MKQILGLSLAFLLLVGCGSRTTPEWVLSGSQQLESYKRHYLAGGSPVVAERHFQRALEELKKSGDLNLLGKAWLTRMALQVAVLAYPEEGEYGKIAAAEPNPANSNYHGFLNRNLAKVNGALLPAQYRSYLKALQQRDLLQVEKEIIALADDSLSQLIAAGLAVRSQLESEKILLSAVHAASQNGWKRALLAWLERLQSWYEARGNAGAAAAVRQRIDLIGK
jgi:hypothetical protein